MSRHALTQIFAAPLLLGGTTAFGLVAALIGDGIWDAAGWLGLGAPLAVTAWCLLRRRGADR